MSNIKQLFYSETQLKDGVKSGLHLLGFLATANDSIQLQFTSKKNVPASATNSLQKAKTQVRLFQSCTQSPAIRTFLAHLLSSEA